MPFRAQLPRMLMWVLLLLCGLVGVAGGLALRGPELVAVGVAGVLAGSMAAGVTRETPVGSRRRSTFEAAASAGAITVGVLLLIAGIAALAGGAVAFLTVLGAVVGVLGARAARGRRPTVRSASGDQTTAPRHPSTAVPRPQGTADLASLLPPVAVLTTSELGQEWTRTSAVLSGPLDPAARAALVVRRQEALDELERRDPAGFDRWLAAGPTLSSDPAGYVRGGPLRGDPAADTDAA